MIVGIKAHVKKNAATKKKLKAIRRKLRLNKPPKNEVTKNINKPADKERIGKPTAKRKEDIFLKLNNPGTPDLLNGICAKGAKKPTSPITPITIKIFNLVPFTRRNHVVFIDALCIGFI